jgi:hypothetical protein
MGDFHDGTVRLGEVEQLDPPHGTADFHGGVVKAGSAPRPPWIVNLRSGPDDISAGG